MGDPKELYHLELHGSWDKMLTEKEAKKLQEWMATVFQVAKAPVKFTLEKKADSPKAMMGGALNE